MKAAKPKPQRSATQTSITFSCSKDLKNRIEAAAEADHRSISNWIVCRLSAAVEAAAQAEPSSTLRAAEGRPAYETRLR